MSSQKKKFNYVKAMSAPYDLYGLSSRLNYFKNLKENLEAHRSKSKAILYRKNLLEHQNKMNYNNEIHRIRGILSQNDTRLPIGTRERLEERQKALRKLGGEIVDEIK